VVDEFLNAKRGPRLSFKGSRRVNPTGAGVQRIWNGSVDFGLLALPSRSS